MKEKYESEIEFTNDEVTMHKNKFNKLRDEYASKEEETIVLQAVVKTKEVQLAEMQKVSSITYIRIYKVAVFKLNSSIAPVYSYSRFIVGK